MRCLPVLALLFAVTVARATPGDLLQPLGPYGTVAVPFAATMPVASGVAAATYLRADGRALGALLAAVSEPGFTVAAAVAALGGGTARSSRTVFLQGQPFDLVTALRDDGSAAYALAFSVTQKDERTAVGAGAGALQLMAWSGTEDGTLALAGAAIDHLAASTTLAFEEASTAAAPSFYAARNPFAASTTLRLTLPAAADVRVTVFDLLGRRVAALAPGRLEAGAHALTLDAAGLAPGPAPTSSA